MIQSIRCHSKCSTSDIFIVQFSNLHHSIWNQTSRHLNQDISRCTFSSIVKWVQISLLISYFCSIIYNIGQIISHHTKWDIIRLELYRASHNQHDKYDLTIKYKPSPLQYQTYFHDKSSILPSLLLEKYFLQNFILMQIHIVGIPAHLTGFKTKEIRVLSDCLVVSYVERPSFPLYPLCFFLCFFLSSPLSRSVVLSGSSNQMNHRLRRFSSVVLLGHHLPPFTPPHPPKKTGKNNPHIISQYVPLSIQIYNLPLVNLTI